MEQTEHKRLEKAITHVITQSMKNKVMCEVIGKLRSNEISSDEFWMAYNQYRKGEIDYE